MSETLPTIAEFRELEASAVDGTVVASDTPIHSGYKMLTVDQMADFIKKERHLPSITGRSEWEKQGGQL